MSQDNTNIHVSRYKKKKIKNYTLIKFKTKLIVRK